MKPPWWSVPLRQPPSSPKTIMATILILIVLTFGGNVEGHYLGEYETPKACQQAAVEAAQQINEAGLPSVVKGAGVLCIPKNGV